MPDAPAKPAAPSRPTEQLSDAELVQRYLEGRMGAFEVLVARHQTRIYRFCLGMTSDEGLAEDLTQAAFLKAARNLRSLRHPEAFGTWLTILARTAVMDWFRKRSRRGWDQEQPLGEVPGRGRDAAALETKQAVRLVLSTLASRDREILLLVDLLGLTQHEAAEVLGLTDSAAKMRLSRARKRFRKLYGELTGEES